MKYQVKRTTFGSWGEWKYINTPQSHVIFLLEENDEISITKNEVTDQYRKVDDIEITLTSSKESWEQLLSSTIISSQMYEAIKNALKDAQ